MLRVDFPRLSLVARVLVGLRDLDARGVDGFVRVVEYDGRKSAEVSRAALSLLGGESVESILLDDLGLADVEGATVPADVLSDAIVFLGLLSSGSVVGEWGAEPVTMAVLDRFLGVSVGLGSFSVSVDSWGEFLDTLSGTTSVSGLTLRVEDLEIVKAGGLDAGLLIRLAVGSAPVSELARLSGARVYG